METLLVTEQEFAKAAEVFRGAQSVRCEPAAADEKSRNAKAPSLDGTEWNPNMKTVY